MRTGSRARPVCFYLPQFHRIPENDHWWGSGFTEWSLVKAAQPVLANHRQPVAPHGDLGYYDLTDPAIRGLQGELARRYGIYGFCYYHYWFAGKRLLETPLELMLEDGYPDLPFCLCWANEPWTRTWSGEGDVVLQGQSYGGTAEWRQHFEVLHRFLVHPNAIIVDGRPLLLIYRPGHIPDLARMAACWRALARDRGLPGLYLAAVLGNFQDNRTVPACLDAGVEHHPGFAAGRIRPLATRGVKVFAMEKVWSELAGRERVHAVQFPGACLHWDNSPRRRDGAAIYLESTPARSAGYLATVARRAMEDERLPAPLVFVNSWNEWSEGTYMEPDTATGYLRLEILKRGFDGRAAAFAPFPRDDAKRCVPVHDDRVDVDALNTLVATGLRADRVLEVGCRNGETGAYAGPFLGASYYRGTDDDAAHVSAAAARLHDSRVPAIDARDGQPGSGRQAYDLVLAFEALGHAGDPQGALAGMTSLLEPGGLIFAGFFNRNHYKAVLLRKRTGGTRAEEGFRNASAPEAYSTSEAVRLFTRSGFRVEGIFRVFKPTPPDSESLNESGGNRVVLDGIEFGNLSPRQVENLHCLRFFIIARRTGAPGGPSESPESG